MSAVTYTSYYIYCDVEQCGSVYPYPSRGMPTAEVTREEAQKDGWSRTVIAGQTLDLCPSCTKQVLAGWNGVSQGFTISP